jgi:Calcineurin-like phosphoesterase.
MSWSQERIDTILELVEKAEGKFISQGPLIRLGEGRKVAFVGDTHGAFKVSQFALDNFWDDCDNIVFLGDYVDRDPHGLENLEVLLSRFLEGDKLVLLRGNHESPATNEYYGFKEEVEEKLGDHYPNFVSMFSNMPYAAVVNGYLCVHGGIARGLSKLEQVEGLKRPDPVPDDQLAFEMLWNDPREELEDFVPNVRGEGTYFYGKNVTLSFLKDNSLNGIVRGHEVADGFRFEMDGKVITVFSSLYHRMRAGVLLMVGEFQRIYFKGE